MEALLAITALPVALPAADGSNVTFNVAVWPGDKISPESAGTPTALNPAPEMLSLEMVVAPVPVDEIVTASVFVVPTFTLPKLRLEGVQLIAGDDVTVSVAAELVTLPTLLLTTTVNCEPLSAVVVAGVV